MMFIKSSAIATLFSTGLFLSTNAAASNNLRNNGSSPSQDDAVLRRLVALERRVSEQAGLIQSLHEERRLQEQQQQQERSCAAVFNVRAGQCIFSDPVTFINDVTIFGASTKNDASTFRVEGDVRTIIDTDRPLVVATETLFGENVFIGEVDEDDRSSDNKGNNNNNDPSLYLEGDLKVLGESFFKDNVEIIGDDSDLHIEGDLIVDGDVRIDGDLALDGDANGDNNNYK